MGKEGTFSTSSFLTAILLLSLQNYGWGLPLVTEPASLSRGDFPLNFIFGAGTSAYQVEGAVAEDGRTPSIWDNFTHQGRMMDKSTADVASDGYHKYKEDVKLMAELGLDSYRFSISWSRLLPNGRGFVNPKGLQFYNNFIDELVKYGIQPHITLYHLEHPQVLEEEYSGLLSPLFVEDFTAFADVCFRNFGDRVRRWTTFAEPNINALGGFDIAGIAPGRCSSPFGANCKAGNSTTEPYIVAHHFLLAHASVVKLYKSKYQAVQKGWMGINVYTFWFYPDTNSSADIAATQRTIDFYVGWILNPLVNGDYPETMKKNAGSRLPSFTGNQSQLVKGSFDYIGINHYSSIYVKDNPNSLKMKLRDFSFDAASDISSLRNATPGQFDPTKAAPIDSQGMQYILQYIRDTYGNHPIFVEENGYGIGLKESGLNDTDRINYLTLFISGVLDAIRNGVNVRGYFVWSLMDVFEVLTGYQSRCGLYHVDFEDANKTRTPKLSAHWYAELLKKDDKINTKTNETAALDRN
ncbi:beta-glucosidase 22-like [Zingiber officinale]|uniref:Beta-glucosidase 22 n=1 Tax=Zingiber officinale TaxID=94328 RepID=A0A8J5GKI1_ZINOF|nr:beta-glucosidase 22-like [Zingiber officinale]KAG6505132.1 hypothetical protein ZIOFF_037480 [Zingiber officinale]